MSFCRVASFVGFFIVRLTSCLGTTYTDAYGDATLFIQTTALVSDRKAVQDPVSDALLPVVANELPSGATMPRAALPPEEILPALQERPPTPANNDQRPLVAPAPPSGAGRPAATSAVQSLQAVQEKTPRAAGGEVSPKEIQQLADFTQAVIKENRELREQNRKWTEYSAKLKESGAAVQTARGGDLELREQNAKLQARVRELTQQLTNVRGQSDNADAESQKELQIAYRDLQLQNAYNVLKEDNEKCINENKELQEKYAKLSAQALKLQSTFRSMEKENRELKFAHKNCHFDSKALSLEKIQLQADVQQSMKLEGDMANEIVGLKKDKEELKTMNAECRRALAMKS